MELGIGARPNVELMTYPDEVTMPKSPPPELADSLLPTGAAFSEGFHQAAFSEEGRRAAAAFHVDESWIDSADDGASTVFTSTVGGGSSFYGDSARLESSAYESSAYEGYGESSVGEDVLARGAAEDAMLSTERTFHQPSSGYDTSADRALGEFEEGIDEPSRYGYSTLAAVGTLSPQRRGCCSLGDFGSPQRMVPQSNRSVQPEQQCSAAPPRGLAFMETGTPMGNPLGGPSGERKQATSRSVIANMASSLSRRVMPMTSTQGGHTESHDLWLQVSHRTGGAAGLRPQRQAQQKVVHKSSMSNAERRLEIERLSQLRRAKMNRLGSAVGMSGGAAGKGGAKGADDRPTKKKSAVGAVETALVYALTCPQGKKYVGKTLRTLTQRQNTVTMTGTRLIREAIKKQGGIKQFKTEVLCCCAATSVDQNEALYIARLGTLHPAGYNEESAAAAAESFTFRRDRGSKEGGAPMRKARAALRDDEADPEEKECLASKKDGKLWLDAAMGGRVEEMASMLLLEPTLIHFRGQGLGQTALHWSCAKGHARAVRFLLDKGANIESSNNNQSRPLHAAAASGSMECVTMLESAGVKVTLLDGDGRSCEQIATQRGHMEVAKVLGSKHAAVTDARTKAANAAQAAAYAAAARDRKDIIPIVSPVEEVIAQGLVSLAVAGDIINESLARTSKEEMGAPAGDEGDAAYMRKNSELEVQLGDVEKKLRLDRLYSAKPQKHAPRVYF